MSVVEKIAAIIKKIPGFRTGNPLGMILSCFMYAIVYMILTINDGVTAGDKIVITVQKLFIFFVPYILYFNIFGVQEKLPFFKNKKVGYVISFCIAILCATASLNFTPKLMSPAYTEMVEERKEIYRQELEAGGALENEETE